MHLRRFISGALSFVFLISRAVDPVFAVMPYPASGFCEEYKTTFKYDRTKVPNPPLSEYLDTSDPALSTAILNQIKVDQLCMQIADAERLISKTTDATRRAQLQKELESLEALRIAALEQLRKSGGIEMIVANRDNEPASTTDSEESSATTSKANESSTRITTGEVIEDNLVTTEELNTTYRYTTVVDSYTDENDTSENKSSTAVIPTQNSSSTKTAASSLTVQKFDLDDLPEATAVGTGVATKAEAAVKIKGESFIVTMNTQKYAKPNQTSSFLVGLYKKSNTDKYVALDYHYLEDKQSTSFHYNQKGVNSIWGVEKHQIIGPKNIEITAENKYLRWLSNKSSPNLPVNFAKVIRYIGVAGFVIGAVADAYNIYKAEDKPREIARVAGGWAGATVGAKVVGSIGAATGASIGSIVPGVGTAFGAMMGGAGGFIVGGVGGYIAGSKASEFLFDKGKDLLNKYKFW